MQCKKCENRLRFDKVTETIKVGTFLRHSVWLKMCICNSHALLSERAEDINGHHVEPLQQSHSNILVIVIITTMIWR